MKSFLTNKYSFFVLCLAVLFVAACKKDKNNIPGNKDILTKKIQEIIPQNYLDTLKKYGLEVYGDANPPKVEGIYAIKPHVLFKSNIPYDDKPGKRYLDGSIRLYDQKNSDFGISLIGRNFISYSDTSIATAISGSGKNFTVYGKVKSHISTYTAVFAFIISGSIEGNTLKNIKTGIINIDNSKGGGLFIKEGQGRVAVDEDQTSESIPSLTSVAQQAQPALGMKRKE